MRSIRRQYRIMDAARSVGGSRSGEFAELINELDRIATRVSLPKGKLLFRCGDTVSGIFVIHSGTVRMSLDGADATFPPRFLGPGELVGLPATLTGTYSLSAQVAEDAALGFVAARRVTELFECSPRLCMLAMRLIGDEIARTRSQLRDSVPQLTQDGF
jgi:CRP-like cAMP-binding protein